MSLITSDFLMGSLAAPSSSIRVLNFMKSSSLSLMYFNTSDDVWLFAKLSGSSPGGSKSTFILMPSASSISIPRSAALMPAASPSYRIVTSPVNRCSNRICPSVSDVPDDATTFSIPDWCMEITSMYPSTRKHFLAFTIACLAWKRPYSSLLFL